MPSNPVTEEIPKFRRRDGDVVSEGRNNSLIVLGRDRTGDVDSGNGSQKDAGSITLVVGRLSEDLALDDDSATIMLSMKSMPDPLLGTLSDDPKPVAVIRADRILFVPRQELIIKVGDASITISSNGKVLIEGEVSFGTGAVERVVKESFVNTVYPIHTHATPAGPSGPPVGSVPDAVFSSNVRTK